MSAALFPDLVVNGETVPHTLIAAEAQNHTAPKGKPGIAWRKAANAVAMRVLLRQEADRQGILADPLEVGPGRFETEEEALIRGLLDQAVQVAPPTAEEVKAEWAKDPDRFRSPPLWEVSHLLVAFDSGTPAERDAAQARARALADLAQDAPDGFGKLARDNSDCPSRARNGALGQLGPGDTVPEFEAVLRTLREGQITADPVQTRFGYHVVRLDALAEGKPLPFAAVQQKIADAMEKHAWTVAAQAFTTRLVAAAVIEGADLRSA